MQDHPVAGSAATAREKRDNQGDKIVEADRLRIERFANKWSRHSGSERKVDKWASVAL